MKNIVIAAYLRSPLTPAHKGSLKKVRADEMAAQVVKALLKQTKVKPEKIEDLIMGCAFPEGEQGFNVAKLVGFLAGLPQSTAAYTLNRFCGSSMQAIHNAAGMIQMGAGEAYICAGMENMSRTPMTGFNPLPHPGLYEKMPEAYIGMGETAENVVDKYKISREEMDEFATLSHQKAAKAQESGHFDDEIVPIKDGKNTISKDECIRPETTAEGLSGLKPAFKEGGSVTAGTSSPLTDGVCAVLICTEEFAKENNLKPLARIKSIAVAGCAPEIMGIGPVPAAKKALERAGITVDDLDVIELNEAFASQSLAVIRDLGLDIAKVNIDGGAIALGHPLGTTGARITGKAAQLLQREGGKYALATQCIGGGQGIATVLEAI
ncbi:MAG: acetyl-CoA C-acyltransferase [Magnetococcales bacterium]|jgi:acetyl-CoA acyltransferase|nr:acetyl-CoA C-acyltransferase [Magnetococcales bacterium]MEC8067063.1 thiolase family protein [Pseudomonadota bacterium]|tara:strand:- start:50599 stop:51735 length:1137 start_codon:yes stop_codon:yes gene_type:complete